MFGRSRQTSGKLDTGWDCGRHWGSSSKTLLSVGEAWLGRRPDTAKVAGSNPAEPTSLIRDFPRDSRLGIGHILDSPSGFSGFLTGYRTLSAHSSEKTVLIESSLSNGF